MKWYVKTPKGITVYLETDESGKIKFYYDSPRDGGYYTPNGTEREEIAKIWGEYEDEIWLNNVCKDLNLRVSDIKKLAKELNRKWLFRQLGELREREKKLKMEIKNILDLLEGIK